MSMNAMNVRYHKYGENEPLFIRFLIIIGIFFLIIKILNEVIHIPASFIMASWLLFMAFLPFIPIMLNMTAQFVADDYTVTFKEAFSQEICIPYITIYEIEVYNQMISVRTRGGHVNRYVEVITFKTNDGKEYTFKAVMDISPDSRIAAMLGADKIFEMGKFKVLKQFIEQKQKDMYSSNSKF